MYDGKKIDYCLVSGYISGYNLPEGFYVSAIVLYHPDNTYEEFVGKTNGIIIEKETGNNGFGYDPIFYSTELNKTFGVATKEEKNSVSHRGRAIKKLVKKLN